MHRRPRALGRLSIIGCRIGAWLWIAVIAGCGSERMRDASAPLRIHPASIEFPRTFLGHPRTADVTVENASRSSRTARLELERPFSAAEELELPGGSTHVVTVTFAPVEPGPAGGVLRVLSEGEELTVPITGTGETLPSCTPSATCRISRLDPDRGECVEEVSPDGASCAEGCLVDGHCVQGSCIGTGRSCDDRNACTVDACDTHAGCVHLDAQCTPPEDPCKAAYCDPVEGCAIADAPDGTRCGPSDCITARVCLTGVCREVAVPEGMRCGEESPCQPKGICRNQQCERPPASVLSPAWTVTAAADHELFFPGVADESGNLYWAECPRFGGCILVSTTRQGLLRYRSPMAGVTLHRSYEPGWLVLQGDLVISSAHQNVVEAYRAADGALVWRRDLLVELSAELGAHGGWPSVRPGSIVSGGATRVYVKADGFLGNERQGAWIFALNARSGAIEWRSPRQQANSYRMVSDELGNLYFAVEGAASAPFELVSFSSLGQERWRRPDLHLVPVATRGGQLFLGGSSQVVSAFTGSDLYRVANPGEGHDVLLQDATGYRVLRDAFDPNADPRVCSGSSKLIRFDVSTGNVRWQSPLSGFPWTAGLLTSEQSVVVASGPGTDAEDDQVPESWLQEIASDGREIFSCELPTGFYQEPSVLVPGYWIVANWQQVVAFPVPGLAPATSGWTAPAGSMARTGRAR